MKIDLSRQEYLAILRLRRLSTANRNLILHMINTVNTACRNLDKKDCKETFSKKLAIDRISL